MCNMGFLEDKCKDGCFRCFLKTCGVFVILFLIAAGSIYWILSVRNAVYSENGISAQVANSAWSPENNKTGNSLPTARVKCPNPSDGAPLNDLLRTGMLELKRQSDWFSPKYRNKNSAIFVFGKTSLVKAVVAEIFAGSRLRLNSTNAETEKLVKDYGKCMPSQSENTQIAIPEYLVLPESQNSFRIFSGFTPNLGAKADIATKYFLKSIWDTTNFAKFLFVVDYYSLMEDSSSLGFDLLSSRVLELFPNISNFANATGLVVVSAGSHSEITGECLSDTMLVAQIEQFISVYIEESTAKLLKLASQLKKVKLEKKIKFAQTILRRGDQNDTAKISFIRSPEKCGLQTDGPIALETSTNMIDMYTNTLDRIPVTQNDLHLNFENESLHALKNVIIPETTRKLSELATNASAELQRLFLDKFHTQLTANDEEALKMLQNAAASLQNFILSSEVVSNESTKLSWSVNIQLNQLFDHFGIARNCTSKYIMRDIESQMAFFYGAVRQNELDLAIHAPEWKNSFSSFLVKLEQLEEFYAMCNESKTVLGNYASQQKLSMLLRDTKLLKINSNNVLTLLLNYEIPMPSNILSLWTRADRQEKEHFARLVRDFLPELKMICENVEGNTSRRLIISGRILLISNAFRRSDWPSECNSDNLEEISVFAMEKIFIDSDIVQNGQSVCVISPIWHVIGNIRFINVTGVTQPHHPKARSGKSYGDHGSSGISGFPGGNAGSFFGIVSEILLGWRLFIFANGGNGGMGQNGGDGQDGSNGKDAILDRFPSPFAATHSLDKDQQIECNDCVCSSVGRKISGHSIKVFHTVAGETGGTGGNGGRGGVGGTPGEAGNVKLICLNPRENCATNVVPSSLPGAKGMMGLGGKGGRGGINGNGLCCQLLVVKGRAFWSRCHSILTEKRGIYGLDGNTNAFEGMASGLLGPSATDTRRIQLPWRNVIDFKRSVAANFSAVAFENLVDSNSDVLQIMSPLAFALELEAMEKILSTTTERRTSPKLILYYESLLDRLDKFAKLVTQNAQDSATLKLVYSAVLSRKAKLQRPDIQQNVISTVNYFEALDEQMEILKTVQKEKVIQTENVHYRNTLIEKANGAMVFVKDTVWPAISDARYSLQQMNDAFVLELNDYLGKAEEDAAQKRKLMTSFEETLPLRNFFSVLNLVGTAVQFLGPMGMIVGSIISSGSSIARASFAPPSISENGAESISFEKVAPFSDKLIFGNKVETAEMQLNVAGNAVANMETKSDAIPEAVRAANKSLNAFKEAIESKNVSSDAVTLLQLEKELNKSFENLKRTVGNVMETLEMESFDAATPTEMEALKRKKERNIKMLKKLDFGLAMAEGVWDVYKGHQDDQAELSKLAEIVKKADKKVKAIANRKNQFYNDLLPALQTISDNIKAETNGLSGQSISGLLVKKWKVKGLVKRIRWYVQQFAKGFKIAERFQICFDTLHEALTLLIDLYDQVERYEEKKQLADFIANVNAGSSSYAGIHDQELREVLVRLDFSIHADMFVEEYQKALDAFKQWVFPFAAHYLHSKVEADHLGHPTGIDELVNSHKRQVVNLRVQLSKYKAITTHGDEMLMVSTFSSDTVSSRPFYVWTNSLWRISIKKLLAGKQVTLNADVDMRSMSAQFRKFFSGKAAIKYKNIELSLRANNASGQNELDQHLKRFHMKMTHSGISIYKVLGQRFVMFDRNVTYRYSFERFAGSNHHVSRNGVKFKVDGPNSDFLMSPYTWWTFQLIDATQGEEGGFAELETFGEEVNLELEGDGVYLDVLHGPKNVSDLLRLEDYYEEFDTERDLEIIEGNECAA